jgi:hypothetical protein
MKFVRDNTTIPVPELYSCYKDDITGHVQIVTEYVEGEKLEKMWPIYTDSEKESVVTQLREYFCELRQVKGTFIGCADNTPCENPLFDDELGVYGPYKNEHEFNRGMITALKRAQEGPWVDLVCNMIKEHLTGNLIVLTHSDFAPKNILVKDVKAVAILDWEVSGYYPAYWEYVKVLRRPDWESQWSKDKAVERILQSFLKELSIMWNIRDIMWWFLSTTFH